MISTIRHKDFVLDLESKTVNYPWYVPTSTVYRQETMLRFGGSSDGALLRAYAPAFVNHDQLVLSTPWGNLWFSSARINTAGGWSV
jgi:hypothetical protein